MVIFLTISRGGVARNLLQNEFYELLKKKFEKIVIFTPAAEDENFINEFQAPNVEFRLPFTVPFGLSETLVSQINKFLIYNDNTETYSRYGYNTESIRSLVLLKSFALKFLFYPLSKVSILRKFSRWVDYVFLQKSAVKKYQEFIQTYKPDVVFCSSLIEESDVSLAKAARKERVKVFGMPKSWDNLSKRYFRAKVDTLVVWSDYMVGQARLLQDYKENQIARVGVPQFDCYVHNSRLLSREEFCASLGLDPKKRIILYGSEGNMVPEDPLIVKVLVDLIRKNELAKECQVLLRPHPGYKGEREKFQEFLGQKDIIVDQTIQPSLFFRDQWDYSKKQMYHFMNSIYHADMVLHVASTLALDATALDKPSILMAFDGYEKRPYYKSVARLYYVDYYKEIIRYNATPIAYSPEEFKQYVNTFLENPSWRKEEREKLKYDFCYQVDGKAGERLFHILEQSLSV